MNEMDRMDVLLIVEAVLENYLAEPLVKDILEEVDQSIKDNWHILQLIRKRKVEEGVDILSDPSGDYSRI